MPTSTENTENTLTREQAEALYNKYGGGFLLKFDHYYKYTFTLTGYVEGEFDIIVGFGGNKDDIYKTDIKAVQQSPATFKELLEEYYFVTITTPQDQVFNHFDI